jgi:hypothetical protein
MIAFCGLTCTSGPAYKATKNNDIQLAKQTTEQVCPLQQVRDPRLRSKA